MLRSENWRRRVSQLLGSRTTRASPSLALAWPVAGHRCCQRSHDSAGNLVRDGGLRLRPGHRRGRDRRTGHQRPDAYVITVNSLLTRANGQGRDRQGHHEYWKVALRFIPHVIFAILTVTRVVAVRSMLSEISVSRPICHPDCRPVYRSRGILADREGIAEFRNRSAVSVKPRG